MSTQITIFIAKVSRKTSQNTLNIEAKVTTTAVDYIRFTPVSQEQASEATKGTDLLKLRSKEKDQMLFSQSLTLHF